MRHWRIAVVVLLLAVPFAVLLGLGSYRLWQQGLSGRLWWPLSLCAAVGYVLAWYWQRRQRLIRPLDFTPPPTWTRRDQQAWPLVQEWVRKANQTDPLQLTQPGIYEETAKAMAAEMAAFYHPEAKNPVGNVTVPEVLAVTELGAHDLAVLVDEQLPGGRYLTLRDLEQARQLADWYPWLDGVRWVIWVIVAPLDAIVRYVATRVMARPLQSLQQDLLVWFYSAFAQQLGVYLIELFSGRLQVGAGRHRALLGKAGLFAARERPKLLNRWRLGVIVALLVLPFAIPVGVGVYEMAAEGWWLLLGGPLLACMATAGALAVYWHRRRLLVRLHIAQGDDEGALKIVEERALRAATLDPMELTTTSLYVRTARELAAALAKHYRPDTPDPVGALTIVEVLTVTERVARDLAEAVDRYLPGGKLLTVNQWRRAAEWAQSARSGVETATKFKPVADVASLMFQMKKGLAKVPSLTTIALRLGTAAFGEVRERLQKNVPVLVYELFVRQVGVYLIELYSGRLPLAADEVVEEEPVEEVARVTVTVLGQVKAGKSSLINALLGEQRARTDVLPATATIQDYQLQLEGIPTALRLRDTVGYAHTGPRDDQVEATRDAAQHSDLLLLVLHARNPARQADATMLERLEAWFASRPDLKLPPLVVVMTHIDLLSPAMEWQPPYDWRQPQRPKARSIHDAVQAARTQLGRHLEGAPVVPVCAAAGKTYGIDEELLPAMMALLGEAQAVGLLRVLRAELDAGKARKVVRQLWEAGKQMAGMMGQALVR
jgi:predicted GTPase